ncbi:hypothetical protein Pmani_028830 [Petrolisthes manimaculis]|uniref:Uncharacterized protein n=1 Tax=Petrolisthes manimaculis TaxID=1843537 RepID=A0AAE1P0P0_9EUCA|nr:hypothetical protein Pmani_028830 [Petrolisthes manimaculis]
MKEKGENEMVREMKEKGKNEMVREMKEKGENEMVREMKEKGKNEMVREVKEKGKNEMVREMKEKGKNEMVREVKEKGENEMVREKLTLLSKFTWRNHHRINKEWGGLPSKYTHMVENCFEYIIKYPQSTNRKCMTEIGPWSGLRAPGGQRSGVEG